MDTNIEINRAQQALQNGNRKIAQSILADVIKTEPTNIKAWLVLSVAVEKDEQRKYCLNKVLQLDPNNSDALEMLGGRKESMSALQSHSDSHISKIFIFGILAALLLVFSISGGSWWYYYGPCGRSSVNHSMAQIVAQNQKWAAALQQASSLSSYLPAVPPATLQQFEQIINNYQSAQNQSIESFQQIAAETSQIEVPSCMVHAKTKLISGMDDTINGTKNSSFVASYYFQKSMEETSSAYSELEAVMKCSPFCNYTEEGGLIR